MLYEVITTVALDGNVALVGARDHDLLSLGLGNAGAGMVVSIVTYTGLALGIATVVITSYSIHYTKLYELDHLLSREKAKMETSKLIPRSMPTSSNGVGQRRTARFTKNCALHFKSLCIIFRVRRISIRAGQHARHAP